MAETGSHLPSASESGYVYRIIPVRKRCEIFSVVYRRPLWGESDQKHTFRMSVEGRPSRINPSTGREKRLGLIETQDDVVDSLAAATIINPTTGREKRLRLIGTQDDVLAVWQRRHRVCAPDNRSSA